MFDNIGGKIKTLTKVLCMLGIILSIIMAIALFIEEAYAEGLGWLIGGCLGFWIVSFGLYGFGELVENISEIRDALVISGQAHSSINARSGLVWNCPTCGKSNPRYIGQCKNCGTSKP